MFPRPLVGWRCDGKGVLRMPVVSPELPPKSFKNPGRPRSRGLPMVVCVIMALSQKSTMCPFFVSLTTKGGLGRTVLQLGGMVMNSRASPEASWMPLSPSGMASGKLQVVV